MPYKHKKKTSTRRRPTTRKRTYKKKASSYRKSYRSLARNGMASLIGRSPFPSVMNTKVIYAQSFSLSCSTLATTGAIQNFSLNGLYDPDVSGTGHQPYAFDQLMAIYARYKVHGCKIQMTVYDPTEDGMTLIWRILNPGTLSESMATTAVDYATERPGVGKLIINNSGNQKVYRSFYIDIGQAAGLTKLQFKADPDNYTGSSSGNPGSGVYLQFAAANTRTGASATVGVRIQATYYATFYERITLPTS